MKYEVEVSKVRTCRYIATVTVTVEAADYDEALEKGEDLATTLTDEDWGRDVNQDYQEFEDILANDAWEAA